MIRARSGSGGAAGVDHVRGTVERAILGCIGAYNVFMASVTVFVYTNWFRGRSYSILESRGLLKQGAGDVSSVVYVAEIYGFVIALIGVVSIVIACRAMRPGSVSRAIIVYLSLVTLFSLGTADWIGLIGYSICLTIYCARIKAIRMSTAGRDR